MRIAFDLDGTLIPVPGSAMPVEPLGVLARMVSREPLRAGAPDLLRRLRRRGHGLWLYSTSLRSPARLRAWFGCFGVRLGGIVNQARHQAMLARGLVACSKYPPAFGIDLLVDDSEGVAREGRQLGFAVLRIAPDDPAWCERIEGAVRGAEGAASASDRRPG